jgi:hypothetical protein
MKDLLLIYNSINLLDILCLLYFQNGQRIFMKKLIMIPLALGVLSSSAMADNISDILSYEYGDNYRWSSYNCKAYQRRAYSGNDRRKKLKCNSVYKEKTAIVACDIAKEAVLQASAYRIAEKATRDGILMGYTCGVDKGAEVGNSHYNRRRGANNLSQGLVDEIMDDSYGSLEQYADGAAERAAIGQANNDVFTKFSKAVTTEGGELPNKTPGNPSARFSGVDNGYNKNHHSVPSINELLEDIYDDRYLEIGSYFSHDYGFNDWGLTERRYRRSRRGYSTSYGVPNISKPQRVWQRILKTRTRHLPRHLRRMVRTFNDLSNQEIKNVEVTMVQPPAFADGTLPAKKRVETVTYTASPREVFQDVFFRLWKASVTRTYNRIVERNLDRGYFEGFPVGEEAGKERAYALGTEEEYNKIYRDESVSRYKEVFTPTYQQQFIMDYEDMASKSVIKNMHWNIIGDDADGVLLTGEKISFEFGFTNIGGEAKEVGVNAGINDVENTNRSNSTYNVVALSQKTFKTDSFLIISEDEVNISEKQADVSISFSSDGNYDSRVKTIFKPAGFENGSPQANLQNSELTVPLTISNPKNISSDEEVVVSMYLNGHKMQQSFSKLKPGKQQISFTVKKDFFEMLDQTFNFKVELSYGGQIIQSRENLSVSIDKKDALVEYFDYLVLNKNAVLPTTYQDQFARYRKAVKQMTREELAPMVKELNDLGHVGTFSNARGRVTKKYKALYKLTGRGDRMKVSSPGIITQLYLKREGNKSKRSLRKLDTDVKAAYQMLGNDGLFLVYNMMGELDKEHQKSYRGATCSLAQVLVGIFENKTRTYYGDSVSYKLSKKKKFSCTIK